MLTFVLFVFLLAHGCKPETITRERVVSKVLHCAQGKHVKCDKLSAIRPMRLKYKTKPKHNLTVQTASDATAIASVVRIWINDINDINNFVLCRIGRTNYTRLFAHTLILVYTWNKMILSRKSVYKWQNSLIVKPLFPNRNDIFFLYIFFTQITSFNAYAFCKYSLLLHTKNRFFTLF